MKKEQDFFKKLIQESLDAEAENIFREVESDEALKDITAPPSMDSKIMDAIRAYERQKEAENRLSEEDKEALRLGRELQLQKVEGVDEKEEANTTVPFRRKKKIFLLVAVVAVLGIAGGITAVGEAPFITNAVNSLLAGRDNINIDTRSEDNQSVAISGSLKEDEAYQKIKDEFGFDPVQLRELPAGARFVECKFYDNQQDVYLIYDIDGRVLEYRIYPNYRDKSVGYDAEDNFEERYILEINNVPMQISSYLLSDNMQRQYIVQFEYDDVNYVINTVLVKNELEEILKNIKFF